MKELRSCYDVDGIIEIWDDRQGKRLGSCQIGRTGSYDHFGYRVFHCEFNRKEGDERCSRDEVV